MNKKRLIITSVFSIVLVFCLMMGSTYSLFTYSENQEDLELNVYQTGVLDITYTVNSDGITLSDSIPHSNDDALSITPYQITVTNTGTVPYMFDLKLEDTTSTDVIDYQYIMVKVGKLDPITLSSCENNVIKKDIIVPAGDEVVIDIRVWISENVQNTEINKSFYAKLGVDGIAIYDDNTEIDNSVLRTVPLLSG